MYNNELYHYGVKGMKWGVRRRSSQLSTDINNAKKRRDAAIESANNRSDARTNKNFSSNPGASRSGFIKGRANRAAYRKAESANIKQLKNERAKAKKQYKVDVENAKRSAVKNYSKKYDEAEKSSNIADKKWSEVKQEYKALGKNAVSRMLNAARNKSDAAKQYNKHYEEASRASDLADQKWNEAKREYVNTGRNRVSRVINNIKYNR